MTTSNTLKDVIDSKTPAFLITDASEQLLRDIQSILKLPITGVCDELTKQAFSKFKSDRKMSYPLAMGIDTAKALLEMVEKIGENYLYLTRTDRKDSYGAVVLRLQYFKNGVAIDEINCCSGQPSKQFFRTGRDSKTGSMEPLPEGRWRIGTIKWANGKDNWNASQGAGLGAMSIPFKYDAPGTTARSAIEGHLDANRSGGAPGTAGCTGFYTVEDSKKVVSWLRDTDPKFLYVNWNLGTCPPVGK
ncbi:hypothetical protein [Scytonema sp. NUACC26]|uniref:hypothetical protein n=1 Tax=Scytonema sp. NUACC26 TaxID=3140176 RepID=UPI0038B34921